MVREIGSVVLAGGGTAGHVNPLLAVADELRAREPGIQITVLGTQGGLEDELVPARGYPLKYVPKVPLPRRISPQLASLPARLRDAVNAAGAVIEETKAAAVVGFGGYVSTPAYFAARRRDVPIVIHEQNARPGLANRLGARWAARVAVTFPGTALRDAQVTGLPLRHEIADLVRGMNTDPDALRTQAARMLGLDRDRPTLVVTGGSLGALNLNNAMSGAAQAVLASGAQVLHLTGKGKDTAVREAVAGYERYHVHEYLADMQFPYAIADLVVCRSGAGTVSELAALGLPAVYVPLPIGNGEQRLNARPVVEAGGGVLVDDSAFTAEWAGQHIPPLLADRAGLTQMSAAAASAGIRDGAARVAGLVAAAVAEGQPA